MSKEAIYVHKKQIDENSSPRSDQSTGITSIYKTVIASQLN